jgi:putative flippase GtrA
MRRFLLYGLNGLINTAITYALYVVLVRFVDYRIAIVAVYGVGIAISYVLNGAIVFGATGHLPRFIGVYALMLLLNIATTSCLVEFGGWSAVLAQLPAIALVYVFGFFLNRQFVFNTRSASK